MCDHLLNSLQNRLAKEGEDLTLHRFESGAMGFASDTDLIEYEISKPLLMTSSADKPTKASPEQRNRAAAKS